MTGREKNALILLKKKLVIHEGLFCYVHREVENPDKMKFSQRTIDKMKANLFDSINYEIKQLEDYIISEAYKKFDQKSTFDDPQSNRYIDLVNRLERLNHIFVDINIKGNKVDLTSNFSRIYKEIKK